jgi:hypothetical protein
MHTREFGGERALTGDHPSINYLALHGGKEGKSRCELGRAEEENEFRPS